MCSNGFYELPSNVLSSNFVLATAFFRMEAQTYSLLYEVISEVLFKIR